MITDPPFPTREHHMTLCAGCRHPLGVHSQESGCHYGWEYDAEGLATIDGCVCPVTLAKQYQPVREQEL